MIQLKLPFGKADDEEAQKRRFGFVVIDESDLLAGRSYWLVMAVLIATILLMGVLSNLQIQKRHQLYRELSNVRQAYNEMRIEEKRLIIEQQTFSATPTVAKRAVNELGMFYPVDKSRLVVTEPNQ